MSRGVWMVFLVLLVLHGLVHLMGFAAYWPLAEVQGLPYKTTLLGGLWQLSPGGMRVFAALWAVAAIDFLMVAFLVLLRRPAWRVALLVATLFSLILTILDFQVAYIGVLVNLVILTALATGRLPAGPLAPPDQS